MRVAAKDIGRPCTIRLFDREGKPYWTPGVVELVNRFGGVRVRYWYRRGDGTGHHPHGWTARFCRDSDGLVLWTNLAAKEQPCK